MNEFDKNKEYIYFTGELFEYYEHADGSKTIKKDKNKDGFKITVNVSGDPEELKRGVEAIKDFYVKAINL